LWLLKKKMGKGSRLKRQNGNNTSSSSAPCNDNAAKDPKKVFQSTQPCRRCEDEIPKLRELNQLLTTDINTSRQEEFRKLAEMESQIHIHEVAATNIQSKMDSMASERELLSQKNKELSTEAESLKAQLNEYIARVVQIEGERVQNERVLQQCRTENIDLQSDLNDSKGRIQDLLRKIEDDTHLWNAEKNNLEGTVADLQTKHELMGSEMGLLTQKNRALSIEVEFFKSQGNVLESELNDSKKRTQELLQKSEDDQHLWDVKKTNLEGILAALQTERDLMAKERRSLTQKNRELSIEVEFLKYQVNEGVKQHSDLIQQYKVAEHSLRQQNETLQEEVNSTKCLLEKQNQRFAESTVENGRLNEQVEELSKKLGELHETNVKLVLEKDGQRMEFESLHAETAKKFKELEEESLKQNEEHGKMIESFHEDLMLQSSRNKALEEELFSTKSCLEEIKESTAKGEVQIANLRSQLLDVEEEKDAQLSDIQRQLLAMAEEKKSQLASLQDELSFMSAGKIFLEEENKSLQTELDKRTSVSEEEKVRLERRERELQTTFNSLNKELQSSKAIAEEKKHQLVDLQNGHSDLVKEKKCLEEKNGSLVTELNRCTMVSEENVRLQNRIRELETVLDSVKKDNESKENRQPLMSERQPVRAKPLVNQNGNGKPKPIGLLGVLDEISENEKPKFVNRTGNGKPKTNWIGWSVR
jgi:chromosome segregation ATPase